MTTLPTKYLRVVIRLPGYAIYWVTPDGYLQDCWCGTLAELHKRLRWYDADMPVVHNGTFFVDIVEGRDVYTVNWPADQMWEK